MALRLACGTLAVLITLVIALGTAYLRAEPERRPERERLTPATRLVPELPEGAPVAATPVRVTPPALLAISPARVPARVLRRIAGIENVRKVAVTGGGTVHVSGVALRLLAVDPEAFRPWTGEVVAGHPEVWRAIARGELVADGAAVERLGLVLGAHYQLDRGPRLRLAASAPLGLPGIDGLISEELGRRLGLARDVVVLVHGELRAADRRAVARALGQGAQVVTVRPERDRRSGSTALVGRPGSYLELYRRSAALCPGLSWTVLAAIGQVESGHGRNNGPSSAGALGPMQFLPSTWRAYGVDGDGDGRADIWSPYDAVPAAAKYLCAHGAAQGGERLRKAIWAYNHSWAYVDKVLALAAAYAEAYP